jgi:hypothetical protein
MVFACGMRACVQPMHDTLCPALCTAAIYIPGTPVLYTRVWRPAPPTFPTINFSLTIG